MHKPVKNSKLFISGQLLAGFPPDTCVQSSLNLDHLIKANNLFPLIFFFFCKPMGSISFSLHSLWREFVKIYIILIERHLVLMDNRCLESLEQREAVRILFSSAGLASSLSCNIKCLWNAPKNLDEKSSCLKDFYYIFSLQEIETFSYCCWWHHEQRKKRRNQWLDSHYSKERRTVAF